MLDAELNQLIVLGHVPGTNLQITFTEILIVLEVALIVFLLRRQPLLVKIGRKLRFYELRLQVYILTDHGKELRLPA